MGNKDGISVDTLEGSCVGNNDSVGSELSEAVGTLDTDGPFVGNALGFVVVTSIVGTWVGSRDGPIVGSSEGAWVGSLEGVWVGSLDGTVLGMRDGVPVPVVNSTGDAVSGQKKVCRHFRSKHKN